MRLTLKSLRLQDFGPIAGERKYDFIESGIIGIVGQNGRGKSHLQAALCLANFGDMTRTVGELSKPACYFVHGLGRDGKPRKAEVEAEYRTASGPLVIGRTVSITEVREGEELEAAISDGVLFAKAQSRGWLEWNGEKHKAADATVKRFTELTKMTSKASRAAAFVRQGAFGRIVHDVDPADRIDAIHDLSGAAYAQKAIEVAKSRRQFLTVVDRSEEILTRTAQLQSMLDEVKQLEAKAAQAQPGDDPSTLQRQYDELNARATEYALLDQQVRAAESELARTQEDVQSKTKQLADLPTPKLEEVLSAERKAELEQLVQTYQVQCVRQQQYAGLVKAAEVARTAALAVSPTAVALPVVPFTSDRWFEVETQIDNLAAMIAESNKFLDVFAKTGKCSTCGASPADIADQLTRHQRVAAGTGTLDTLRQQLRESQDAMRKHAQDERTRAQAWEWASQAVKKANDDLAAFGAPPQLNAGDFERATQQLRTSATIEQENRSYFTTKQNLEFTITAGNTRMTTVVSDLSNLRSKLQQLGQAPSEESRQAIRTQLEQSNNVARSTAELQGRIQGIRSTLGQSLAELKRLKDEQANAAKMIAQARMLDGMIAAMHRDEIPSDLSANYVSDLNAVMREVSLRLSSPFILRLSPNFTFVADGETGPQPMFQLSGGQKTLASWIWHLALHTLHGAELGILFLDEPTEGLDADNLSGVADVLERLGEFCSEAALQVFIITHEQEVLGRGFNQVIVVE